MPEGPEIRRAADQLERRLVGQVLKSVEFHIDPLRGFGPQLRGARVLSVTPRSKALLIRFSDGRTLYSHNQLYGRWSIDKADRPAHATRALKVALVTATHVARLYSATDIELLDEARVEEHPYIAKLGVEPLGPGTTLADLARQADKPTFARRQLASLLLDQGFYSGLGNYLRSEILYVARLRHTDVLGALSVEARTRLAEVALALTRQAYRARGITNDLERAKALKARGEMFARYRHHVFSRDGERCWECGALIERCNVGGRGVYYCRVCQGYPR